MSRLQPCFLILLCIRSVRGYNPSTDTIDDYKKGSGDKLHSCNGVEGINGCAAVTHGWYYHPGYKFCFLSNTKMCVYGAKRFKDCDECSRICNTDVCTEAVTTTTKRRRSGGGGPWYG